MMFLGNQSRPTQTIFPGNGTPGGEVWTVTSADAPSTVFPKIYPGFGPLISSFSLSLEFTTGLVAWTGAYIAPLAGTQTFSVLYQDSWTETVTGQVQYNVGGTGADGLTFNKSAGFTQQLGFQMAEPVSAVGGLQVQPPTANASSAAFAP